MMHITILCKDVGIAEEHAVTFAAGLAAEGMKPVCAIYSSFLQRSFDQIMEDAALQKLPVVFAIDRAGIVGADGETHHGLFDISYMSLIPDMTVLAPCDGKQLREMMRFALKMDGLAAVRYPRGCCSDEDMGYPEFKGENIRVSSGVDADIWAVGPMVDKAVEARAILAGIGIDAGIVDVTRPHPVDTALIEPGKPVFTVEDGIDEGGFGQQLKAKLAGNSEVTVFAWPEKFIEHGSCEDLYERYGLSGNKIAERIRKQLEGEN